MIALYHLFVGGVMDVHGHTNPATLWKRTPFRGTGIPHERTRKRLAKTGKGYEVRRTGWMAIR